MKIVQTNIFLKNLVILIAFGLTFLFIAAPAMAATSGSGGAVDSSGAADTSADCSNSSDAGVQKCLKNNQIVKDLNFVVDFLATGVGIVVIGTIIAGGIQYAIAGDNAQQTGAAKQRIINGLIALVAFIFTFGFLQWLIPGGL